MLLITRFAVDRPTLGRLEGDLVLGSTFGADDLMHLSGTPVVSTPFSITQYFHSYSLGILRR